ncbi:MAG: prenyltransferase/squalene oxidase repeat-containing protein [Planctomycetota bacterium]|nr:prenyltransferase/squalene oxidase repeat-containing protein [Planctomycetota bacterium]
MPIPRMFGPDSLSYEPPRDRQPSAAPRSRRLGGLVLAGLWLLLTPVATAEQMTQQEIDEMVQAMVTEFRARHHPVRQWEPEIDPNNLTAQPTGRTALAALALLEAGEPAQSPKLAEALEWMQRNPADGTYAICVRLMVWCRLPEQYRDLAKQELKKLVARFSTEAGGWEYLPQPRPWMVDSSATQYGLQALADAQTAGLDVPGRVVDSVRQRFLRLQTADGGWGYRQPTNDPGADDDPRGSLTAAGLATLALCERIKPSRGRTREAVDRSIAGGIAWLDRHFDAATNPGATGRMDPDHGKEGDYYLFYWLHSLERAGRATGLRRFGNQDWFDACAVSIRNRMFQGDLETGFKLPWTPQTDHLALALFTLHRGLESVPLGFFDTTDAPPVSDTLGPAARTLSDVIEEGVGWIRIGIDDSPEAWSRLPVVVVRGDGKDPWLRDPNSPEARRILDYAAAGGVVVTAPTDRGLFTNRLVDLFQEAFPQLRSTALESGDALRREPTPWRGRAQVLETPVRRWLIACPKLSLGGEATAKQVGDASNMLAAICLAETGGRLPSRAAPNDVTDAFARKTLPVARWRYAGNWNPEPAALDSLANHARTSGIALVLDGPVDSAEPARDEGVIWLTGDRAEDAAALDLEALTAANAAGRRLLIESLDQAFTSALTARLAAAGWTLGAAPAGCPPGSARINPPDGPGGLLVTAGISRPLLGRPTGDATSIGDVIGLVSLTADLAPTGSSASGG